MSAWDDIAGQKQQPSQIQSINPQIIKELKSEPEQGGISFADKTIEDWLFPPKGQESPKHTFCCMIYGDEGTFKTGLLQSYPLNIREQEKHIILDLDGGNVPLMEKYNKHLEGCLIARNPLQFKRYETPTGEIMEMTDYLSTIHMIRRTVEWCRQNRKKQNIKAVSIDGLSKLLKHAEYQMRLELHIDASGGVQYNYWKKRFKDFIEPMEQIKAMGVDCFFVAHNDFIKPEEIAIGNQQQKFSAAKEETSRMMWQKVLCYKEETPNEVLFKAKIHKSKYNTTAESQTFVMHRVNKQTKEYQCTPQQVFEALK